MAYLTANIPYNRETIMRAYLLFEDRYRQYFDPSTDAERAPKDPENALAALIEYTQHYQSDHFETLYTEVAGSVSIGQSRIAHFRLDAVVRDEGTITLLEHKTSSYFGASWQNQWSLSVQIGLYLHALQTMYPDEPVRCKVNGCFFAKKGNSFLRVPIIKAKPAMQVWLDTENFWFSRLEQEMDQLAAASEDDQTLLAFPLNPTSCSTWSGCQFRDFCTSWANPLQRVHRAPIGFEVDWWDPRSMQEEANKVVELD
jgi:hypothetical protein